MRAVAAVLVLCLWVACASAAITVDAVTISGGSGDFGDDTFAHTVASDANLLVVCTSTTVATGGDNSIVSITYNGDALTQLLTASVGNRVELWYRLAPDVGANNVVVDAISDPFFVYTVISLKGVDQVTPTHTATTTGSSTNPAITVTSAVDEFVIDCLTIANDPVGPSAGAGQTQRTNTTHDGLITSLVSTMAGASPNVQPDWTLDAEYGFGYAAVSLAPAIAQVGRRRIRSVYP